MMEFEEMGLPIVKITYSRALYLVPKRDSYDFALTKLIFEHLKEDIQDALDRPEIAEECLVAAQGRIRELEKRLIR